MEGQQGQDNKKEPNHLIPQDMNGPYDARDDVPDEFLSGCEHAACISVAKLFRQRSGKHPVPFSLELHPVSAAANGSLLTAPFPADKEREIRRSFWYH